MSGRTWTIARREFLVTITRKGFLLTLVLMPAWIGFAFSLGSLPQALAGGKRSAAVAQVGVVDSAGVLAFGPAERDTMAREAGSKRYVVRAYPSLAAA